MKGDRIFRVREDLLDQLTPKSFVRETLEESLQDFLNKHGDTYLIFVSLGARGGELAAGLAGTMLRPARPMKPSKDMSVMETNIVSDIDVISDEKGKPGFDQDRVIDRLTSSKYFVSPLRIRSSDDDEGDRITVGRGYNMDIVLRHVSVSKFHAWFICDKFGDFHIADAKSTNGTFLNGLRLNPEEPQIVDSGSDIQFGSVSAWTSSPEQFWRLLHGL